MKNDIQLRHTSKGNISDYTCDRCSSDYTVALKPEPQGTWEIYCVNHDSGIIFMCPELIKWAVYHNSRLECPRCDQGILFTTTKSRFNISKLLKVLRC